ncbi:Filamentous Growth Regulator [Exophiala oligosperma]
MTGIEDETKVTTVDAEMSPIKSSIKASEVDVGELISYDDIDPALEAKMHLVNNAINQLGFTTYHWKLFCLSGFGYAADSLVAFLYSITVGQVVFEYQPSYIRGGQLAFYVGALVGALFWGISADIIGRKWAFNISLLLTSIFGIICGAADNWIGYCSLVCLTAFACGGNLVLDTTVFLEFLPSNKQWLVTLMAIWWGVGQTIAGLLAWAFIREFIQAPVTGAPVTIS